MDSVRNVILITRWTRSMWASSCRKVSWVLDADIKGFFDAISSMKWMLKFLEHRIADQRLLRLCRKWLRAGVSEAGQWSKTEVGTPQGSVISPVLANLYLHHVLDLWVDSWRKIHVSGEVYHRALSPMTSSWGFSTAMGSRAVHADHLQERMAKFGWNYTKRKPV